MQTRPLIPPVWQIPEVFRQRLGSSVGRQRLMHAEGHLLLVLHCVPEADEQSRRGRLLWRDASSVWHVSDLGTGKAAVRKHLEEYREALDRLEQLENQALKADQYLKLLESLAPVVRAVRNQHQVFQDARNLVREDRELLDYRDMAYELDRMAELLYTDAKNAMDVAVVRRAEEQAIATNQMNRAAHRLNLLASFFFPLATISSIFGSGFHHGWETRGAPIPFLIMICCGLVCGAVIAKIIFNSRRVH